MSITMSVDWYLQSIVTGRIAICCKTKPTIHNARFGLPYEGATGSDIQYTDQLSQSHRRTVSYQVVHTCITDGFLEVQIREF